MFITFDIVFSKLGTECQKQIEMAKRYKKNWG